MYNMELYHWWYRVRRDLIHDLIHAHLDLGRRLSILDVGCGGGALMKELEIYGNVFGVDFSDTAIDFCKRRNITNVQKSGIELLPFPAGHFDLVLAMDVLEHIPKDDDGVREVFRVLKSGGILIVFVPAFMFLWGITDELSQHYRRYTIAQVSSIVESKGFTVVRKSYFNTFLFIPIAGLRLLVRLFRIKTRDENKIGGRFINKILYMIFSIERLILRYINMPFGVSCMIVAKK